MTPDRILRAAEVLREEAERLRDSHAVCRVTTEPDWDHDEEGQQARESHDEMLALADELEPLAVFMAQIIERAQGSSCDALGILNPLAGKEP